MYARISSYIAGALCSLFNTLCAADRLQGNDYIQTCRQSQHTQRPHAQINFSQHFFIYML